ncbi:hypothetical protein EDEG_01901 [Edhazardia aedis USNM 41457]|uniref:Uncharacterized protein n=1 Tax=Edhazardia aedis (strain USNM 41457) TaxID=1003232 RepID=J9D8G1_EDHAE|nr:hypothetical protein EDEG_01901 [Edhazardia aedis USNM 41457]|eukprot:EJW03809.1 hypothetical protein EDEG_01901 [Edhazardia aedis USNM 41457]
MHTVFTHPFQLTSRGKLLQPNRRYYDFCVPDYSVPYVRIPKILILSIPVLLSAPFSKKLMSKMLYMFLKNSGYSYMKLGQWLASRPDLFGRNLVKEMSKLHDNVPIHSLHDTLNIISQEILAISRKN